MDIKIVTMNNAYNYGAMLQAYALQKTLKSLGHNSEFIDQRIMVRKKIHNLGSLLKKPFEILYKKQIAEGYKRFENFIKEEQQLTDQDYSNYNDLLSIPPKADAYITGSDQVWNPIAFSPICFLDFVKDGTKKVSYAASLGVNFIPKEKKAKFKEYLNDMDCISVREETAKELISALLPDKEIHVNIDPIFLLNTEQWCKLAIPPLVIRNPYILCYILYRPRWLNQWLKSLKKATKLDVILVDNTSYRNIYNDMMIRNAGPKEFLWLISNAEKIVTSSFHGTAFSALFNKDFYSIVNPNAPCRISCLINKLCLAKTMILPESNLEIYKINYEETNRIIDNERKKALDYLKKSLHKN